MSILKERLPLLETVRLDRGSHSPDGQFCVMELAAYLAGETWSASPKCASKVITSFLVNWNDNLDDDARQMLKPLVPLVIGTRTSPRDETTRAWMATDWLARECAPAFLRCAGLTAQAGLLESLAPLTDAKSARAAQPSLNEARTSAYAARAAARAAARDAAGAAAGAAARAAAWAAAWAAARAAAWAALAPTVSLLQTSAYQLVERMCEVGRK